jgi:hypothetical protein
LTIEAAKFCVSCTKDACCCTAIHISKKPSSTISLDILKMDDCCTTGVYKKETQILTANQKSGWLAFYKHAKALYSAALGIEILCIAATEIGENTGLYLFGFNLIGIPIAYAMGYALAGFTTFATILGRYSYGSNDKIESCCSVLEQGVGSGFIPNLKTTFRNFAIGIAKLPQVHKQPNLRYILKTSLYLLITAESACILTAETVDLIFYQYSMFLAVPLALLAGAFTVAAPEAYRKAKSRN